MTIPLYTVISDSQIQIRDDGPQINTVRILLAERMGAWSDDQHEVLKREANGVTPYYANVPPDRVMFHMAVVTAVCRMRDVLGAHPAFQADYDSSLSRAIQVAQSAAEAARGEMRHPTDAIPVTGAAIRAIGKEFSIPMPKWVSG